MTVVITTVHGTFAKRAAWAQPESRLNQYLAAHLGDAVRIAPFAWSARNSFEARDAAANELREHFESIERNDPETYQFVLAHSHGGNVALFAAANAKLSKPIGGIVCLSTPFLQSWPRDLGLPRILTAAAGIVLLLANLIYFLLRDYVDRSALWISLTVIAMPTIYVVQKVAARLVKDDKPRWVLPKVDPLRVLILRAAGDEASAALGAATLASNLVAKFWGLTSVGAPLWERALKEDEADRAKKVAYSRPRRIHALIVMGLLVLGIILLILTLLPLNLQWTNKWAGVCLIGSFVLNLTVHWRKGLLTILAFAVLAPLWWLSMILTVPVLLILCVFAVAFGPSLALRHFLWIVSAEPTPPGTWITVQLNPETRRATFGGLMHNSLYDDTRAHTIIADWMVDRLTGSSVAQQAARHNGVEVTGKT